jgi:predicted SAM-dependent methyltransferase
MDEAVARLPRLNVGCGHIQPEGWVNVDNSNRAKLASSLPWLDALLVRLRVLPRTDFTRRTRTWDVRKKFPLAEGSVGAIYNGEMLEHLTAEEGKRFLAECFRILAPGGVLRVRVPDNYRYWKKYTNDFERARERPRQEWTEEHVRYIERHFSCLCTKRSWFTSFGHFHKWMYDEISLTLAFEQAGFVQVERKGLYQSRIPDVRLVESCEDLTIEGVKPAGAGHAG